MAVRLPRFLDSIEGLALDRDRALERRALQGIRTETGPTGEAMSSYRTVAARSRFEPERSKNSRFVADVAPIAVEDEGLAFVAELWEEFPDASHVCFAWRIGARGDRFRVNDDGEPGASAGLPILRRIDGHELSDVIVAVTRWFGGTKLGVGGLVRAYGGAAGMALDRAQVRIVHELQRLRVRFHYADTAAVESVLRTNDITVAESDFGELVQHAFEVPVDDCERIAAELRDATSARARVERG